MICHKEIAKCQEKLFKYDLNLFNSCNQWFLFTSKMRSHRLNKYTNAVQLKFTKYKSCHCIF